eukprot:Sdes_comp18547_c0_seq1m8628
MRLSFFLKGYGNLLRDFPLRTKCTTAFFVFGFADITCQLAIEKTEWSNWNMARTLRNSCTGLLFIGPMCHYWMNFLDLKFGPSQNFAGVFKKVLTDQLFAIPVVVHMVLLVPSLMAGAPFSEAAHNVVLKGPEALMNAWKVWSVANTINFAFVPLPYRVLYTNVISTGWNCYLSSLNHRK